MFANKFRNQWYDHNTTIIRNNWNNKRSLNSDNYTLLSFGGWICSKLRGSGIRDSSMRCDFQTCNGYTELVPFHNKSSNFFRAFEILTKSSIRANLLLVLQKHCFSTFFIIYRDFLFLTK